MTITPKGHPKEWWEAVYAYGTKIGWGHFDITNFEENGRKLAQIDNQNHIAVDREGQRTTIDISTRGVESPEGELLRFRTEMNSGTSRTVMEGRVADGQLTIETTTPGKTTTETFPWTAGTLGFSATEQSLAAAPLAPGDRRTLRALMPATNEVVTIELAADKFEPTSLLDHTEDLLRIDCAITLPMQALSDKPPVIRSQLWTNREGEVLKTTVTALHQETFRTRREIALADSGPRRLDLVIDNNVPVARALSEPHQTHRVRYRVQLTNDDPAKVFFAGPLQELVSLDPHTAEIVVRQNAIEANSGEFAPMGAGLVHLPTPEDRAANNLIQSDDPQVVALAKTVLPDETDQRKLAVALEKYRSRCGEAEELLAGLRHRSRSGPQPGRRLHRTRRVAGGIGPGTRHSGPRGDWVGVPGLDAELRLPHVERTVGQRTLAAAGCHAGPRRNRRRASQAERFEPRRRPSLQLLPAGGAGNRADQNRDSRRRVVDSLSLWESDCVKVQGVRCSADRICGVDFEGTVCCLGVGCFALSGAWIVDEFCLRATRGLIAGPWTPLAFLCVPFRLGRWSVWSGPSSVCCF